MPQLPAATPCERICSCHFTMAPSLRILLVAIVVCVPGAALALPSASSTQLGPCDPLVPEEWYVEQVACRLCVPVQPCMVKFGGHGGCSLDLCYAVGFWGLMLM